jgi:hypothetical protein
MTTLVLGGTASRPVAPEYAEIPAFPPIMIAQQAHHAAGREGRGVNFGSLQGQRLVPQQAEQRAVPALAQAIGAFPALAARRSGLADAVRASEFVKEAKLTIGGPAITADVASRAHRPAWITNGGL